MLVKISKTSIKYGRKLSSNISWRHLKPKSEIVYKTSTSKEHTVIVARVKEFANSSILQAVLGAFAIPF
jgi:hypothetical protein